MKVNIGCGGFLLDGYVNVDMVPPADVVADFWDYVNGLEDGSLVEVRMDHFLEHQPTSAVGSILQVCRDVLKPGGMLVIEVPDLTKICEGVTGPVDLVSAIYGVQTHAGEFHRTGFTKHLLTYALEQAGFREIVTRTFLSDHPMRQGFPCLLGAAQK